eukprot:TRINITY_DN24674_c0_g1_i1.p1 TRINITY_DN24674_c0_g1~~TRINITY_DN24674_c0_g1_i1.p1  ORF type:complete len:370 (+),score=86.40 TRINITY_DN24674_c0_g1_i1:59-1168(+)
MRRAGLFHTKETEAEAEQRAEATRRREERRLRRRDGMANRARERRCVAVCDTDVFSTPRSRPQQSPIVTPRSPTAQMHPSPILAATKDPLTPRPPAQRYAAHPRPTPPVGGNDGETVMSARRRPPSLVGTKWSPPLPALLQTFRPPRDKDREQWPSGGSDAASHPRPRPEFTMVVGYLPAEKRAAAAAEAERARHWPQPIYDGPGANTRNNGVPLDLRSYDYRKRVSAGDIHAEPMRFGVRTQLERVSNQMQEAPLQHFPALSPTSALSTDMRVPPTDPSRFITTDGADFSRYHAATSQRRPLFSTPAARSPSPFTDKMHSGCTLFGLRSRDQSREMTSRHATIVEKRRGFVLAGPPGAFFQNPSLDPL